MVLAERDSSQIPPKGASRPRSAVVIGGLASSLINFRGQLLLLLRDAGYSVTAMAGQLHDDASTFERLRDMGVDTVSLPLDRTGLSVRADLECCIALYRALSRIRPDIVIAYTAKPVIYGSIASALAHRSRRFALITGLGYAFTEGGEKRRFVRWLLKSLYRRALQYNELVFFQNPDDLREFRRQRIIGKERRTAITNGSGVDTETFSPVPLPGEPTFLLVARLLRDKGIYEYVEAAREARRVNPHLRFLLVGPIDSNPAAIRQSDIDRWQDEGCIEYLGSVDDVRPAISACSVYVLPSYREGTPRTVLEAMSMGRAIITTDVPGCRETVIDGVNGRLVPARDVAALTKAMLEYAQDPKVVAEHGAVSRTIAEQKYDVRKVNKALLQEMQLC